MKILVTGAKGQLGYDIVKELDSRNIPHMGIDIDDCDITSKSAVYKLIEAFTPTVVIHCAAYTAVDKAEDEQETCRLVNEEGTRNIALACKQINAKLIYISTDYVFAGTGSHFNKPTDATVPLSVYGKTKLAGEKAVQEILERYFIVRITGAYGHNGHNFVKTMLRLGKERTSLNIVRDQVGTPTYTADLAPLLCDMAASEKYGVYHATNEGVCSWAEFATEIFRLAKMDIGVNPIPTSEYPTKAARPLNFRLDKSCLDESGFARLPHWKDALARFINLNNEIQEVLL